MMKANGHRLGRRLNVLVEIFLFLSCCSLHSLLNLVESTTVEDQVQHCLPEDGDNGSCIIKDTGNDNVVVKEPTLPDSDDDMRDNNDTEDLNSPCEDLHMKCEEWAKLGECRNNKIYMQSKCKKSCGLCPGDYGEDDDDDDDYEDEDEETGDVGESPYGIRQLAEGSDKDKTMEWIKKMEKYMSEEVFRDQAYSEVRDDCKNRHELCSYWAMIGECQNNPSYMQIQCAPSCLSCKKLDMNERCPLDDNVVDSMLPGELNKMFERIVESPEYQNKTTVLSQPKKSTIEKKRAQDGPWVITIDNFITDEECDRLIELGAEQGYKRSTDVGKKKFDGSYEEKQSATRTSDNAWCQDGCFNDPSSKSVTNKIEILTGIPDENSENLQLLRYFEGQFYRPHHDFIPHHVDRRPGPRIMTAFLYLNDVEAGGGTNFPLLNITVMPKKGKLLLWPSVKDSNLNKEDPRTKHQALAVEAGVKYAANGWIHLREFKKANDEGCI